MSITMSMMEIVKEQMIKHGVKDLKRLKVRVGELTAVEPEALQFCFEVYVKGTPMEGAALEIEEAPLMGRCVDCDEEFRMEYFLQACPRCEGGAVTKTTGHELDIVSMEAE
ncbi:MAG: hydrogenase maturation nickel metallochaperone HypA [Deltaproteobacteria bacterium]|nr:hydrogenase maturation nickel metallochaperone HypA [Deltaproteobacteria bacterium]